MVTATPDRVRPRFAPSVLICFAGLVLLRCVVVSLTWPDLAKLLYLAAGAVLLLVLGPRVAAGRRGSYLFVALLGFAPPLRLVLGGRAELTAMAEEHGRLAYVVTGAELALALALVVTAMLAYRAVRPPRPTATATAERPTA